MKYFLTVIAMVMILEGTPWFLFPDKMKKYMETLLTTPDKSMRAMGLALMAGGMILLHYNRG